MIVFTFGSPHFYSHGFDDDTISKSVFALK